MNSTDDHPGSVQVAGIRDVKFARSKNGDASNRQVSTSAVIEGLNLKILEHLKEDGRYFLIDCREAGSL